jgi:Outer membrane protein beta-barrel domain
MRSLANALLLSLLIFQVSSAAFAERKKAVVADNSSSPPAVSNSSDSTYPQWDIAAVGGITLADPTGANVLSNSDYNPQVGYLVGALANFYFHPNGSIELGALFVSRQYSAGTANFATNGFEVPGMVRWWPFPFFSIGVGGYLHQFIGNLAVSDASGNYNSQSFASQNLNTTDLGLVGGAQFRIPILTQCNILLDGRFLYGLTDLNSLSSTGFYERTFEFIGGFGVHF